MGKSLLSKDFVAGGLFAVIGIAALVIAGGYAPGSPRRMGPGMFPMIVGGLMVLLGSGVAIRALVVRAAEHPDVGIRDARPLLIVLLSIAAFAVLVDRVGLVAALVALVALAQAGDRTAKLRPALFVAVLIPLLVVLLFVFGLGIPFQLGLR